MPEGGRAVSVLTLLSVSAPCAARHPKDSRTNLVAPALVPVARSCGPLHRNPMTHLTHGPSGE